MKKDFSQYEIELPKEFELEIKYYKHSETLKAMNYKGVEMIDSKRISFKTKDLIEVVRAIRFLL